VSLWGRFVVVSDERASVRVELFRKALLLANATLIIGARTSLGTSLRPDIDGTDSS
jgi:hypothetical protein